MSKITAKSARILEKNNATTEYVMAKYGFETPDELLNQLRRVVPTNADELFKAFQKNSKKNKSKRGDNKDNTITNDPVMPEEEIAEEETVEEIANADVAETKGEIESREKTIADLKMQEIEQSQSVIALEVEHEKLQAERFHVREELQKINNVLAELQRLVEENSKEFQVLACRYEELAQLMQEKTAEISFARENLEITRQKLSDLTKVIFCIYNTGVIEIENGTFVEVVEAEERELMLKLIEEPEAEGMTIKTVKAIAKVVLMTQNCESFEVLCDTSEAQLLYEKAVAIFNA